MRSFRFRSEGFSEIDSSSPISSRLEREPMSVMVSFSEIVSEPPYMCSCDEVRWRAA